MARYLVIRTELHDDGDPRYLDVYRVVHVPGGYDVLHPDIAREAALLLHEAMAMLGAEQMVMLGAEQTARDAAQDVLDQGRRRLTLTAGGVSGFSAPPVPRPLPSPARENGSFRRPSVNRGFAHPGSRLGPVRKTRFASFWSVGTNSARRD